ncbi:hypothetical protein CEXT_297081 [Caerostris extrusa]|uniref:Uncharacterized protein n=1 Tax=Caerostris extrusa TaxID=172846 RepID=A0AAV4MG50_CAEEX|nr:hypothetical protein CEXT_297081 [Caerostris extrusa]
MSEVEQQSICTVQEGICLTTLDTSRMNSHFRINSLRNAACVDNNDRERHHHRRAKINRRRSSKDVKSLVKHRCTQTKHEIRTASARVAPNATERSHHHPRNARPPTSPSELRWNVLSEHPSRSNGGPLVVASMSGDRERRQKFPDESLPPPNPRSDCCFTGLLGFALAKRYSP